MSSSSIDCSICCSENIKKEIVCGFCNASCCMSCAESYLLTIQEANCMSCKKSWDERFLRTNFRSGWIRKQYKDHITKMLVDREKSYIPATMPLIEQVKIDREAQVLYREYSDKSSAVYREFDIYKEKKNYTVVELKMEWKRVQDRIEQMRVYYEAQAQALKIKKDKTDTCVFVKKCPLDNCQGYLNDKYHCALCDKTVCKDCHHEVLQSSGQQGHKCLKDNIETVKYLLKETKPCPKCHTRISKIDGCDQMFCISCKTAWGWTKGEIDTGKIHNPEYLRWMRETGQKIKRFDNVDNNCLNQEMFFDIMQQKRNIVAEAYISSVGNIVNFTDELFRFIYNQRNGLRVVSRNASGARCRGTITRSVYNFDTNRVERIDNLLETGNQQLSANQIKKMSDEFNKHIMKQHKCIEYDNMIYNMVDTLVIVIEDTLRIFQQQMIDNDVKGDVFGNLCSYIGYFNTESAYISKIFNYTAYSNISIRRNVQPCFNICIRNH